MKMRAAPKIASSLCKRRGIGCSDEVLTRWIQSPMRSEPSDPISGHYEQAKGEPMGGTQVYAAPRERGIERWNGGGDADKVYY